MSVKKATYFHLIIKLAIVIYHLVNSEKIV